MANKPLTVVIVNDFDYVQGGASKVAIDTAKLLYEKDIDVIFFSSTHKENNYMFKQITTNQKECLKDGINGALRGLYNFKVAKELKKLLSTLDKDNTIIHVHGWTKSLSSSIFRIAFKMNFKVVLTLHDYFTACPNGGFFNYKKNKICKYKPLSIKCLMCNCDSRNYLFKIYRVFRQMVQNYNMKHLKNVITISDFSFDKLEKYFNTSIKSYKVYNPITLRKNKRTLIENNKYYIYVGRVSKEKGVEIFCEALTKLKKKAIIVGDGEQLKLLKEKYKNSYIEFVGWKNSNEVKEYMNKSKALVFPSKWYEGAPLTIMESLALGLPCIVSKNCAASEFIDKSNGLIFDGTVDDLIRKIEIYEKIDIKILSESAYRRYWNNPFDESTYINHLIKVYKDIMKGK